MALDPDRIDAALYDDLRRHFTDAEIVELGAFIGFNIGYHTFFGTLRFYPMFAPDGRLVSQEESARIYGAKPRSLAGGVSDSASRCGAGALVPGDATAGGTQGGRHR